MYRLASLLFLLITALPSHAVTRYISDELRVPLRQSPCSRCAIIHRGLVAGLKLNEVETQEGWSHVTTPGGLDGWLESQYLVNQPVAKTRIAEFELQNEKFKTQNAEMESALASAQNEIQQLGAQLAALRGKNQDTTTQLKEIQEISSDTVKLHSQNQELLKQNKMLQSEIDVLKATSAKLASNSTQKWFFYGALSVFMGALLSVILPRFKRKRRGYSEWA